MRNSCIPLALTLLIACSTSSAQTTYNATLTPAGDRWMYPFGGTPGIESSAPTFRTPSDTTFNGQPAFDDRDAELILIFDTTSLVPTQRGPNAYLLSSIAVRVTTSNPPRFAYDPSFDSVLTPDTDPGTPVELFAAGFRNGFSATSFQETSPFAFTSPVLEGVRNAYPAMLNTQGSATTDLSNQIRDAFDATPLAIATAPVAEGALVPQGTEMTFVLNLSDEAARRYVQRSLDTGRLVLVVSSLHLTTGGPGGGSGDPTYPSFYTRDSAVGQVVWPKLDVHLTLQPRIDFNNDGLFPDSQDLDDFINALAGASCPTCSSVDANGDGLFPDSQDLDYLLCIFAGGGASCN
jgi:hypothetical protein